MSSQRFEQAGDTVTDGSHAPDAEPARAAYILRAKDVAAPSVFVPENMLREARRQKSIAATPVPEVCVLDPDGDIFRYLRASGRSRTEPGWACYHTEMDRCEFDGATFGIVPHAVGASFAVLVAEEMFASGCRLLISMTSAGRIGALPDTACFVLIERALRDEGTSLHYLPPSLDVAAPAGVLDRTWAAVRRTPDTVLRGAVWTTDAPFRETAGAIASAREHGALAVEMEAAALYAFARARGRAVVCFAHVTNSMAVGEGDFEKGDENGSVAALHIIARAAVAARPR